MINVPRLHTAGKTVAAALLAVMLVVSSSGCLQPSLNPLIPAKESVFDDSLLGSWACGADTWTFARDEGTDSGAPPRYRLDVQEAGKPTTLVAWLGRLDERLYINFSLVDPIPAASPFIQAHVIGAFTFGQITIEPGLAHLAMLSAEWVHKAYASGLLSFAEPLGLQGDDANDPSVVLTGRPQQLQRLARAYAGDDHVFGERIELVRLPAGDATNSTPRTGGSCFAGR